MKLKPVIVKKLVLDAYRLFKNLVPKKLWKFTKFSFVGGICAVIDYLVFFIGLQFFDLNYMYALCLSVFFSGSTNFILNKFLTFKNKSKRYLWQSSKFAIVVVISIMMNFAIMYLFVDILKIYPLIARLLTILIMWGMNFLMHSTFTFRK